MANNIFINGNTIDNIDLDRSIKMNIPKYIKSDSTGDFFSLLFDNIDYSLTKIKQIQTPFQNIHDLLTVKNRTKQNFVFCKSSFLEIDNNAIGSIYLDVDEISSNNIKEVKSIVLHDKVNLFINLGGNFSTDVGVGAIFDNTFPSDDKFEWYNIQLDQDETVYDSTVIDVQDINDAIIINYVKTTDKMIIIQLTREFNNFEKYVITKYLQCVFEYRNTDNYNNIISTRKKLLFEDLCNVN